jgi:hypothetical protein
MYVYEYSECTRCARVMIFTNYVCYYISDVWYKYWDPGRPGAHASSCHRAKSYVLSFLLIYWDQCFHEIWSDDRSDRCIRCVSMRSARINHQNQKRNTNTYENSVSILSYTHSEQQDKYSYNYWTPNASSLILSHKWVDISLKRGQVLKEKTDLVLVVVCMYVHLYVTLYLHCASIFDSV